MESTSSSDPHELQRSAYELLSVDGVSGLVNFYLGCFYVNSLDDPNAPVNARPYFQEQYARMEFNRYLKDSISGSIEGLDDHDYLSLLQIGLKQKTRLKTTDTTKTADDLVYEGVNHRVQKNPEFARIFAAFTGDLYEFGITSATGKHAWKKTIETNVSTASEEYEKGKAPLPNLHWREALMEINRKMKSAGDLKTSDRHAQLIETTLAKNETDDSPLSRRVYAFSPHIQSKNTTILSEYSKKLDEEPADWFFGFDQDKTSLTSFGADLFRYILQEASASGWANASALLKVYEGIPKREMADFGAIILLSNALVGSLNQTPLSSKGKRFSTLSTVQLENIQEAIDRCMYIIFDCGKQPSADPTNYLLSSDIVGKAFVAAFTSRFEKESEGQEASDSTNAYQRAIRAIRGNVGYWEEWKKARGLTG